MVKGSRSGSFVVLAFVLAMVATMMSPAPAGALPAAPTGLSPNGTTFSSNPPLTWAAVPGATSYGIQVSDQPGFGNLLVNEGTYQNTFTPYNKLPIGPIYWRVYSQDPSGNSPLSAVATFTITKPDGPVLSGPADHSVLSYPSQPPTFTWSTVPGVVAYYVDVSTSSTFASDNTRYTMYGPSLTLIGNQQYAKKYYWRVSGVFTNNETTAFSATYDYTQEWTTKPVLTSPANGSTVRDVEFVWQPVQGATKYLLEVSKAIDFTGPFSVQSLLVGTRYAPQNTLDNGSYYWRVRPMDAAGNYGTYSDDGLAVDPFVFTRGWPQAPTLISPNNGQSAADPVTFQWTPIPLAAYYQVQVGTDPNFSPNTYQQCNAFETTMTPYGGNYAPSSCFGHGYGTTYYWRVRGIDYPANVVGLWSPIQSFLRRNAIFDETTDPNNPVFTVKNLVTPLTPANGSTSAQPVLTWKRDLTGVASFHLKVVDKDINTVYDLETVTTAFTPYTVLDPAKGPYKWYVTPRSFDGLEGLIPSQALWWSFNVTAPVPDTSMALLTPANNASSFEMPTMTWKPYTGATHYLVKYSVPGSNVNFTLIDVTGFGYTSSVAPLPPGPYDWWVEAYTNNVFSAISATRRFNITPMTEQLVHNQVTCPLCANHSDLTSTPMFRWSPVPGATSYLVYIALDANFTNNFRTYSVGSNLFIPQEEFPDNTANEAYYWHVRPCYGANNCSLDPTGRLAQSASFTKRSKAYTAAQTTPADAASIQIPANPSSGLPPLVSAPTFTWPDYLASVNSQIEASNYQLQIATDEQFQAVIDQPTVDQTFYTPSAITYPFDTTLHWRVRAIDGFNNYLKWSDGKTFTRKGRLPVQVSPTANQSISGVPTFTWQGLTHASQYRFEMYRNADTDVDVFGNPNLSPPNLIAAYTTPYLEISPFITLPPGVYAWRIAMVDGYNQQGPWPTTAPKGRKVTVTRPAPSLVEPIEGKEFTSDAIKFRWEKDNGSPYLDGVAYYRLQSSLQPDFSSFIENRLTVMNSWAPNIQYPVGSNPIYWRVKAYDGSLNEMSTSITRTFYRLVNGGPGVPTNLVVTNRAGGFTVAWGAPLNPGNSAVTGYTVTLTPGSSQVLGPNARSFTYAGLTNGNSFQVRVSAINTQGSGPSASSQAAPNGCAGTPFSDVAPTTPFCAEIAWLYGTGVTQGTVNPDGSVYYQPSANVSRLAMASFLWRTAGQPATNSTQFFEDVPPGSVPPDKYAAIQWMGNTGLSLGTPNPGGRPFFVPNDAVSRQAMAAFLYRFAGNPPVTPHADRFADVTSLNAFYNYVQWMGETGLSLGTPNPPGLPLYKPVDPVTRMAMAAFLFRFHNL